MIIGLDGTFPEELWTLLEQESSLQFTHVGTTSLLSILSTTVLSAEAQIDPVRCPQSHTAVQRKSWNGNLEPGAEGLKWFPCWASFLSWVI